MGEYCSCKLTYLVYAVANSKKNKESLGGNLQAEFQDITRLQSTHLQRSRLRRDRRGVPHPNHLQPLSTFDSVSSCQPFV